MLTARPCWDCGTPTRAEPLCPACGKLQPPTDASYFAIFGLPERFALDPPDLETRYHALARLVHPDRHLRAAAAEQSYATARTERLNRAHETLADPLARARYLLRMHDVMPPPGSRLPLDLAERTFALQSVLIELRMSTGAARARLLAQVLAARDEVDAARAQVARDVELQGREADRLREGDEGAWRERLGAIAGALETHSYLEAMRRDLDSRLDDAGELP